MSRSGIFVDPVPGNPPVGTAAQDARLALSGLIGSTPRLVSGGQVTQSASTMQFTIAAAVWQLPDPTSSATFLSATDAITITLAAGPATGSRIDSFAVKQNNYANGDADSTVNVTGLAGIASGTPVAQTLPAGYFRFANITVPTNAANAAACTVTLLSPQTLAPLPIQSPTLALLNTITGTDSQLGFALDTDQQYLWLAGASTPGWKLIAGKPNLGAITFQGIYSNGGGAQVYQQGEHVGLEGLVTSSSANFALGNTYTIGTIPTAFAPAADKTFACLTNVTARAWVTVKANGTITFSVGDAFGPAALNLSLENCQWRPKGY